MCGLSGVLSTKPLSKATIEIFNDLMIVSTLRGVFGSGIVTVPASAKKEVRYIRSLYTAAELTVDPDYTKLTKNPVVCMMGHARQPTKGGFTLEECHPHVCKHIVGMHNGTMRTIADQPVVQTESDSRKLFESIAEVGLEKTLLTSDGAYTLAFLDTQKRTLSFIRNEERPLSFMFYQDDASTLFWSSEMGMLRFILSRAHPNRKLSGYTMNPNECLTYSLRPRTIGADVGYTSKKTIAKPEPEILPPVQTSVASVPLLPPPVPAHREHQKSNLMFETGRGLYLTEGELEQALAGGCAYCGQPQTRVDFVRGRTHFFQGEQFICDDCATHDPLAKEWLASFGIHPTPRHH